MSEGAPTGILVVDKAPGLTSQQVVGRVRRLAGTRKVGHAGTLDPMATGVLVVGLGRATRLLGHLMRTSKEYAATIRFGQSTLTDDAEGAVTASAGAAGLALSEVQDALSDFTGVISQVPTAVSAIKVDGVRSYARVRAGEDVVLKAREVTVHSFSAHSATPTTADDDAGTAVLDVEVVLGCSSGTYVRALARDLGRRFGTGGHLTALRRTRVGVFGLDRSTVLDPPPETLPVLSLDDVAGECFPRLDLDPAQAEDVRHGRRLVDTGLPAELTAVFDPAGAFLALYRARAGDAVAEAVFV